MRHLAPLLLAFTPGVLFAAPYDDVTCGKYPDADAVIVDSVEEIAYRPDGTYVTHEDTWTKVLTDKGLRETRVVTVDYSKRYGRAAIEGVWIVGTNGVERAVDVSKTTHESTDNDSMGANIYDPLDRKIVCTVPPLKVGDVLHVREERSTFAPRCQDQWADISILEWDVPMVRAKVVVKAPKERPLRQIALRHPIGNVVYEAVTNTDGIVHSWTATNSPQAFPEPNMPPLYAEVQSLHVSTAENWREISRWYWKISAPHLAKTSAAMSNEVKKIGHDLRAIYKWVSQEVRYMGLTLEDVSPGYAPHDVDLTFANRYGVCRDKAALLVAMLRIAGFEAYPVLINASAAKMDEEVPMPYFNHAIVAVAQPSPQPRPSTSTYILLDPTDESSRDLMPSYLCDCSYLVARPDGEDLRTTSIIGADRNRLSVKGRGTLARDRSLFAEYEISATGINDTIFRHRLVKMTDDERSRYFAAKLRQASSGAELLRCKVLPGDLRDTETPLSIALSVSYPDVLLRGQTQDELALPTLSRDLGAANFILAGRTSLEKRKYPLRVFSTAAADETFDLDLAGVVSCGRGLQAASLPPHVSFQGGYSYDRAYSLTNGHLRLVRTLALDALEFSPAQYGELRERLKEVEAAERRRPVFRRNPLDDADTHILLHKTDVSRRDACNWVATNTVVREILTYAGKKECSELKFEYNPSWKTVSLLSASVSNRNGKVTRVTPKEINVMDAAWVASAPRYPAGKMLIVSLPSVEIGSVISYTTVSVVTNAPAPFRNVFYFDAEDPTDRIEARVDDWARVAEPVKRIKDEAMSAPGVLWRDCVTISDGDFAKAAERLAPLAEVEAVESGKALGRGFASSANPDRLDTLEAIRNWMTRNVRLVGPGIYELPLDRQATAPETVLSERYATRLDYVRTLVALLKGADYDADIVFVANDADDSREVVRRILETYPYPAAFATPLARIRVRDGGFWGFGGAMRTLYVGPDSEYTPLGTTAYDGAHFLDPTTGEIGLVRAEKPDLRENEETSITLTLRENGAADVDYSRSLYGYQVGAFRKRYIEMLPEDRSRHHQQLLGAVAQAASATSELNADVRGYPATLTFSAYVPDYAVLSDGGLDVVVPAFDEELFALARGTRENPIEVPAFGRKTERVTVVFPEGYDLVERLPEPYACPDAGCVFSCTAGKDSDGRLRVVLTRTFDAPHATLVGPTFAAYLRDISRLAASPANRTVTVRRRL